jgi:hypothetical protein
LFRRSAAKTFRRIIADHARLCPFEVATANQVPRFFAVLMAARFGTTSTGQLA